MRCGKPVNSEVDEYCVDCEKKKGGITQGRSLWVHSEPVSGAVYRFKYKNKRCWGRMFAEELYRKYGEQICFWKIGQIIPVPLHSSRRRKRGYNQAQILGEELSCLTGIPCRSDVLLRIKKTKPQKQVQGRERRANMLGAFAVVKSWKPVKNVLLIDDIYTTGATVDQAAEMLKTAGVQNVYFLTISIGQGI